MILKLVSSTFAGENMDDMYIDRLVNDYNSMRRERDEARAEVEQVRGDRQAAISEALATSDACWRMEQEVLQRERDEARAETQRLIELNRSHVATLCEAQRKQVEALKAENERLQRLLDHLTQSNPGTSVLVMLMNEAKDAKKDYEALEHDAARVLLAYLYGDAVELDEAIGQLMSNGRHGWWKPYKPLGLRGEDE